MKKRVMLLVLTLVLVLGITQVASAAGWGMGGGRALDSSTWTPLAQKLNLTDDQAQKLKDLDKSCYEATKDLRARLQDAMFELRQMGFDKNPDKAAVDAKIKEINDLRAQLQQITQQNREKMQSILTPEQQSQMKNWRGHGGHRGCRMGGPNGQAQTN